MRMKAARGRRMLRSELLEIINVFMAIVFLRFGFCFGVPADLLFVSVHVPKRRDRLKPATVTPFF